MSTMGIELQPFDSHPANPADLQAGADNLVTQGAEAMQNESATRQAYAPAISSVTGDPAAAVARASDPVQAAAGASSSSLVWAGVATRYWGQQVSDFNQEVEIIKVDLFNAITAAREAAAAGPLDAQDAGKQVYDAQAAANADAERRWYAAHNRYVVEGGARVHSMLRHGPTPENQDFARDVGAMPDVRWGALDKLGNTLMARLAPPDSLDGQLLAWMAGSGLTLGAAGADGYRLANGTFISKDQLAKMPFAERYKAFGDPDSFRPKPGRLGGMAAADAYLDNVTNYGASLAAVNGAVTQYSRDMDRPELSDDERDARAATRSSLAGGGGYAGAQTGIALGQAVGSLTSNKYAYAGATNVGVFLGGAAGSWIGNGIADWVIDD